MKTFIILLIGLFIAFEIGCNAQPNTKTTFEVGIVNPVAGKTYIFFGDVKADSTNSQLQDGMDYLNPNVSALIKVLTNQHTIADTLFGEFQVDDKTFKQYVKPGLVQRDNISMKYSGMKTGYWISTDVIEAMQAGFFMRRKN